MADRRPDFQLSPKTAETIISMLELDYNTLKTRATPAEICQELGINRRTFNSVISRAIFTEHPTEAQTQLRTHIMETLHTQWYLGQEE